MHLYLYANLLYRSKLLRLNLSMNRLMKSFFFNIMIIKIHRSKINDKRIHSLSLSISLSLCGCLSVICLLRKQGNKIISMYLARFSPIMHEIASYGICRKLRETQIIIDEINDDNQCRLSESRPVSLSSIPSIHHSLSYFSFSHRSFFANKITREIIEMDQTDLLNL